ncbi:glycoside hydrolase family 25 protein [Caproicibacterium sp. ZCY20-5]|uniref:glycoside hydrolase family 25 protein n=1 Tax=Caproicibacterium sp. XB1 TaxID=3396405 RepID=UPI0023DA9D39
MNKTLKSLTAAVLTVGMLFAFTPCAYAATYAHPTSITGVTVSGHPLTEQELSKGSYLINLVKGHTVFFDVTSSKPVNFTSGNSSCAVTGTTWSYNRSSKTTRYTITGTGKVGQTCGLYLDKNRIFQAQIIDQPTSNPFVSDTNQPMTLKIGQSYTFKITLKNSHSNATFQCGTGSVFSTYAPPGTTDKDGNKVYLYKITAQKAGGSGIYVVVDGVSYSVFAANAIKTTNTAAALPVSSPYRFTPTVSSESSSLSYKKGIDVSEWQKNIDWEAVKKSGVDFVMLRAGYGSNNLDAYFERNITECNRLGIPVGVYWFSYATNATEAAEEAQDCLNALQGHTVEYPVCYDLEYDTVRYAQKAAHVKIDKALATSMAKAFCSTIEENQYYAMNYANSDYIKNYFDMEQLGTYDLWYAHFCSSVQADGTVSDALNTAYAPMWQYTSSGSVGGISGSVDMDVTSLDYAEIIRSTGLNHLSDISADTDEADDSSTTLRSSASNRLRRGGQTTYSLPADNDRSTPAPGRMSQPNYQG